MTKLFILIGLPASGKSTLAKGISNEYSAIIHSSDELRLELYSSYNIFDKNNELFDILHARILADLNNGKNVIYDATNLTMKNRRKFLKTVPNKVEKNAVVVATNYTQCVKRDLNRYKNVGENIIKSMRENFQFPLLREGFDNIIVRYSVDFKINSLSETFEIMKTFNQDNPNHNLTLGEHCLNACKLASDNKCSREICDALLLHDLGKLYTKVFKNKKGEKTDIAHYYNHHNVSAYEYMFYFDMNNIEELYICQLINYHMQPYFIKTEKSQKKWLDIFGEKMYNDIMEMNKYDRLAH